MDGSCVTFIREVSVDAVAQIANVWNIREIDFSSGGESPDRVLSEPNTVAMFRDGEWTVVFAWSSLPEQLTYKVAGDPSIPEAVLVYWDINDRSEFAYWAHGRRLVRFDGLEPDERVGEFPHYLDDKIALVGSIVDDPDDDYPDAMLALADQITGLHLDARFLSRPVKVGVVPGAG